ncbi:MAG: 2-oxoglutarate and iron-dependent oxygenase domain-containing protein, partial [Actinomycetota bacterium]|nr:2-oxoglutarate and iron-dependent oxygenase domain-containing protein [Actinomycetota bacterium]
MSVPTIDLRDPIADVAARLDDACSNLGFVQVTGHGLDAELERDAWSTAQRFFALADSVKRSVAIPVGDAYGYGPYLVERLAASRGGQTPADMKETYSIGPFVDPADVADVIA